MTFGVGRVLAIRNMHIDDAEVSITVGQPQPFPSSTGQGWFCRSRIEGIEADTVCGTGATRSQALMSALSLVCAKAGIGLPDFLSEAYLGFPDADTPAPSRPDHCWRVPFAAATRR